MRKRHWHIAARVALVSVLLLPALGLWIRSCRRTDHWAFHLSKSHWQFVSSKGWIRLNNQPEIDDERRRIADARVALLQQRYLLMKKSHEEFISYQRTHRGDSERARELLNQLIQAQADWRRVTMTPLPPVRIEYRAYRMPYFCLELPCILFA